MSVSKSVLRDRCSSVLYKIHYWSTWVLQQHQLKRLEGSSVAAHDVERKERSPKIGNERRVGPKQKLNAGSSEVCARTCNRYLQRAPRPRPRRVRQEMWNEGWRMPGAPVHDTNFNSEDSKTPLLDLYMRRRPDKYNNYPSAP